MALFERVMTLLRANLNDLVDRSEDPEKMFKQLILDMENQLLQVKTQVAIAIADQHMLEKKKEQHEQAAQEWSRKAALAVARERDDLAKQALARSLAEARAAEAFTQQLADGGAGAELLRANYEKLQQKLADTRARFETLQAAERRARSMRKAHKVTAPLPSAAVGRYEDRVLRRGARNQAELLLQEPDLGDTFAEMDREEQVSRLLAELKAQRALGA